MTRSVVRHIAGPAVTTRGGMRFQECRLCGCRLFGSRAAAVAPFPEYLPVYEHEGLRGDKPDGAEELDCRFVNRRCAIMGPDGRRL